MTIATTQRPQRKASKTPATLTMLTRATYKSNGCTVYRLRNEENGNIHHVTINAAGVCTCCLDTATNETCSGFHYRKTCNHAKTALSLHAERGPVGGKAPAKIISMPAKKPVNRRDIPLNGNQGFSFMAPERSAS